MIIEIRALNLARIINIFTSIIYYISVITLIQVFE